MKNLIAFLSTGCSSSAGIQGIDKVFYEHGMQLLSNSLELKDTDESINDLRKCADTESKLLFLSVIADMIMLRGTAALAHELGSEALNHPGPAKHSLGRLLVCGSIALNSKLDEIFENLQAITTVDELEKLLKIVQATKLKL